MLEILQQMYAECEEQYGIYDALPHFQELAEQQFGEDVFYSDEYCELMEDILSDPDDDCD